MAEVINFPKEQPVGEAKRKDEAAVNGTQRVPDTMSIGAYVMLGALDAHMALFEVHARQLEAIGAVEQAKFFVGATQHFMKTRARVLGEKQPQIILPPSGLSL